MINHPDLRRGLGFRRVSLSSGTAQAHVAAQRSMRSLSVSLAWKSRSPEFTLHSLQSPFFASSWLQSEHLELRWDRSQPTSRHWLVAGFTNAGMTMVRVGESRIAVPTGTAFVTSADHSEVRISLHEAQNELLLFKIDGSLLSLPPAPAHHRSLWCGP